MPTVTVTLGDTTRTLDWPEGTLLLDTLLDAGIRAPYACREGACATCMVRLEEGEVRMQRNEVLDAKDLADGYRLACQSEPVSAHVRVVYGD
jgi:3-ketosteroid 9alpha-monooxygenase subunit B